MATITLYAKKINNMPGVISDVKKSVGDFKSELSNIRNKSLSVNKDICNLDDVISCISGSTQIQQQKIDSLESLQRNCEQFIEDVVKIDNDVADLVNQRKDDFYNAYSYLKPECEKNGWEKLCDGVKSAGQWCKENWKSIGKIVLAVVIIAAIGIASVLTGGVLATILGGAFWGALIGGGIGGVIGGISSAINGRSFIEGFADGLLSGAVTGAVTGAACAGIGLAGQAFGKGIGCLTNLAKAVKVTSQVTKVISLGMDGFDIVAMGIGLFDPNNPLVEINQKLHSSTLYNGLQIGVNALAIFTAGATMTAKCFVAGTMILSASGLVAIENIKAGDKVISTNPDTFEVSEKTVVETYIRETTELVNLTINGELIKTTYDHPFYVKEVGFVNAGELYIGDKLLNSKGQILVVDDINYEKTDTPITVYNFQVEDFHTYHVGENEIWVHNANCRLISNGDGTYDAELSYKENWTPEQRAAADEKCKLLTNADTKKTIVNRKVQPSVEYKKVFGKDSIKPGQDIDHIHDLQLGGVDDIVINGHPLDSSVNRSLGRQISYLIKDLDYGTILQNFKMINI